MDFMGELFFGLRAIQRRGNFPSMVLIIRNTNFCTTFLAPSILHYVCNWTEHCCSNCEVHIHIYADDTNLYLEFAQGSSFYVTGQSIAYCLREVELFMLKFFLKPNVNKTQLLNCAQKNKLELFSPRFVDLEAFLNLTVCRVQQGKPFGTVIDQSLQFDDMMNQVCTSGFYQRNKLKNVRTTLMEEHKLTLV